MYFKLILLGFLCVLIVFTFPDYANTSSLSPPPSRTGAPGETTCATSCHTGNLNTGPGVIGFSLNNMTYSPDSVISIAFNINDSSKSRFGFQLTALDSNDSMGGEFVKGPNSGIISGMNRQYISHLSASGINSWQFSWKSPKTNVGPITFYAVANASNNNGSNSGDNVYTKSFIVQPSSPVSISNSDPLRSKLLFFPNPISDQINIEMDLINPSLVNVKLININGGIVSLLADKLTREGLFQERFNISNAVPRGLYFLQVEVNNTKMIEKIIIQ